MKTRSLGIALVVLTAVSAAFCQSGEQSLLDCPSAKTAKQTERLPRFDSLASVLPGNIVPERNAALARIFAVSTSDQTQEEINRVRKLFYPAGIKRPFTSAVPSASSSADGEGLLGRAARAASQTVLAREESGKSRLNTAYLLRTLASAAADSASKPYWRRSPTDPVGNFGSSVGNDAGTNLWHEFGPSIEHAMKNNAPKFLSRIEEQIAHSGPSRAGSSGAGTLAQNAH
jgi:hypothetical protein